ncbi:MAG: metalloregulator ArsR/SmtB family transcription factor [Thermoplasmatales archaeon]
MENETEESCVIGNVKKIDARKYQRLAEILAGLANSNRIAILNILTDHHEVCTCELESALGIPQPTVTAHLHKLYERGLLKKREEWRYTYYSINPEYRELIDAVLKK